MLILVDCRVSTTPAASLFGLVLPFRQHHLTCVPFTLSLASGVILSPVCWDGHLCGKSWTRQSHTQGFSRTGPDITKGALNAPGKLQTIYGHREHMLAHGLTGLICTYIHRTIWLCPYGWSMDYFATWGRLLYDWTVSEWHVYLQSLQSLSYMHTPSFYTYAYTLLRFRVHMKS